MCAVGTAGSSRHLFEHIESSFARPEIGIVEHCIGIEHAHCGDIFEIQTFRYHLGAYEHLSFSFGKSSIICS